MTEIVKKMVAPVAMSRVARDSMLFPKARDIWLEHALLESASDGLAAHLSSALPGQDGPLLRDCLIDAVSAYRATEQHGDMEAMVAYLVALLRRATDVFDLSVEARVVDGAISWDPLRESLQSFVLRNAEGEISVSARPVNDGATKNRDESTVLLAARLMPEPIARRVVRHVMSHAKESGI
ncbi:hypothetical protein [Cupriavidus sp. UYPR2.512]|uniref:hypothetical protein n=1 Tax=Cupriavidus sp. UYPR2.512 TaxID=1080187 RepID=UPI0003691BC2|nr:hypothetical protein [Cupriavidus sp. UYPR2.512]UIF89213.1 hypothetical protein KAF44_29995 [Cupriavidus necator]